MKTGGVIGFSSNVKGCSHNIITFSDKFSNESLMSQLTKIQGCGVGVGRDFRWTRSRSRKKFLGGVGVGKNVPTPTPTTV
jgi:hypothetical protein